MRMPLVRRFVEQAHRQALGLRAGGRGRWPCNLAPRWRAIGASRGCLDVPSMGQKASRSCSEGPSMGQEGSSEMPRGLIDGKKGISELLRWLIGGARGQLGDASKAHRWAKRPVGVAPSPHLWPPGAPPSPSPPSPPIRPRPLRPLHLPVADTLGPGLVGEALEVVSVLRGARRRSCSKRRRRESLAG